MDEGIQKLTKITMDSQVFQRVAKNLTLEDFTIDEAIAQKAIDLVNSGEALTPEMIKEVVNLEKI